MSTNPFVFSADHYGRDYNIINTTVEGSAHFLSRMTGDPEEECRDYVRRKIMPGGDLGMKDPEVRMLHRDNGTDRERGVTTFTKYLSHVQSTKRMMSPTMTVYERAEVDPSPIAFYIDDRVNERKVYKKIKFDAEQKGNQTEYDIAESQQSSCKIDANALSGAHNSEYSILFIKSAHSTLTSTCRCATAYANANNEKFLQGNRHYWKPEVAYNNIATISVMADMDAVEAVVEEYGLVYPTPEQAFDVVYRCTEKYWWSDKHYDMLKRYLTGMSPVERAAFVYIGDLYHLAILNPEFTRGMLLDFISEQNLQEFSVDDPSGFLGKLDDDTKVWLTVVEKDIFRGLDYKETVAKSNETTDYLSQVAYRMHHSLEKYRSLIQAFWATKIAPASVAVFPSSVRRSVIAGDTDSTIFTVQWWVEWFCGDITFTREAYAVGSTVVYFTSQMTIHLLAMMSGQMGIAEKDIFRLSMKNEFCFPIFVPTNRSKHYFAFQLAQEGKVFKDLKLELKGAELRSSSTPKAIKDLEEEMIKDVMQEAMNDGIDLKNKLYRVARIENQIRRDILEGKPDWFRTRTINTKETYTNPYSSVYQWYEMWNEVFAPKYGEVEEPPYMASGLKILANTKTEIQEWLTNIKDQEVAKRLEDWIVRNNKKTITEIMIPLSVLKVHGLPEEFVAGTNFGKVIYNIMSPFYIILETLGMYYPTTPHIQLVSDEFTYEEVDNYFALAE